MDKLNDKPFLNVYIYIYYTSTFLVKYVKHNVLRKIIVYKKK